MSKRSTPVSGVFYLLCIFTFAGSAHAAPQKWGALSSTAMAITGSVSLSEKKITFDNGQAMWWKKIRQEGPYTLYTFTTDANPLLLADNQLCGSEPPSFALVQDDHTRMTLSIFESYSPPELNNLTHSQYGFCASYLYMRQ